MNLASASLTIRFCEWFQYVAMVIGTYTLYQFSDW
jgi:hypothetical protein